MSLDNTPIKEVEDICEEACALKREINALNEVVDEKSKALRLLENKICGYLEHFGKTNWPVRNGNLELRTRTSVKVPRDEEAKRALFAWLQKKGIFYETTSVNSNTLNALYRAESEACAQEGRGCEIPGIDPPTEYTSVIIKPK